MSIKQRAIGPSGNFYDELAALLDLSRKSGKNETESALSTRIQQLSTTWQDKIGLLLNRGRSAHENAHVYSSMTEGLAMAPLDINALRDEQTRSQQYLERGLAMMVSESVDLAQESPPAESKRHGSVFERAWAHFGRELAGSEPDEWSWVAQRAGGASEKFEKLFLRRGDGAWWSFGSSLDRPHRSQVGRRDTAARSRKGNAEGSSLASLATRQYSNRRALQRAMRSVQARLGIVSERGATTEGV